MTLHSCSRSQKPKVSPVHSEQNFPIPAADRSFVREQSFGLSLELLRSDLKTQSANLTVSPHSLLSSLGMVLLMARGTTEREMIHALKIWEDTEKHHTTFKKINKQLQSYNREVPRLPEPKDEEEFFIHVGPGNLALENANRIFVEEQFPAQKSFFEAEEKYYPGGFSTFSSSEPEKTRKEINEWVSKTTRKSISELLPPGSIKQNTALILVNAMFLSIGWDMPFSKSATKPRKFHLLSGKRISTDMMFDKEIPGLFGSEPHYRWADINLEQKELGMLVIVPRRRKWKKVLDSLSATKIHELLESGSSDDIIVTIPKFKVDSGSLSLRKQLERLGMRSAFSTESANFSGFNKAPGLSLEDVHHRTVVEIHEKGIEASAATGSTLTTSAARLNPPKRELLVNRPFLFFIHDRSTGVVLFSGRLMDPRG